jgi:nucleoside-diphosphate-sugar epimerase
MPHWLEKLAHLTDRNERAVGIILRVLADIIMVNVAMLAAFQTWLLFYISILKYPNSHQIAELFWGYIHHGYILWTVIFIATFYVNGFYTRTRGYQTKYKALVILRGVTLGFVIYIFADYYMFRGSLIPRGVTFWGWLLTLILVGGSRVFKDFLMQRYSLEPKQVKIRKVPKRILVIGGAGYIGSLVTAGLLERGYEVRVLDSLLYGPEPLAKVQSHANFELIQGDFRNVQPVVAALRGCDAVIHLAAIVGDPACAVNTQLTYDVNYAATRMVTELCKGAGVSRFLFASTCSVYGASNFLMDEQSQVNPISLYAQTKLASEQVLLSAKSSTFYPTILRLATVFGLSPRPRFDLVVNLLTAKAIREGKCTIYNGEQWRPFIHVLDIARAFLTLLEAPLDVVSGEIFNVGSYRLNYTLTQVAEKIREQIPSAQIEFVNNQDARNYRVSFDKLHTHLGFTCIVDLERGIAEMRRALESGEIGDYRDKIYSNVAFIKDAVEGISSAESTLSVFSVLEPADTPAVIPVES